MPAPQRFVQAVEAREVPLAQAFLGFALAEYPHLDVDAYLRRLDALAQGAPRRMPPSGAVDGLQALGAYLAARLRGNAEDYYDPRNSFLNEVLDRGLGLPITLSVIWMEVGRRVGLPLAGIGIPLHFLVGLPGEAVYADPFDGGRLLGAGEAAALLERVSGGRIGWRDDYLRPLGERDIVRRALGNLKAIYGARGDLRRVLWVEDCLLAIPGAPPGELRDRAAVLAALGRVREAVRDLRAYCATGPEDAEEAEARARQLLASLN